MHLICEAQKWQALYGTHFFGADGIRYLGELNLFRGSGELPINDNRFDNKVALNSKDQALACLAAGQ